MYKRRDSYVINDPSKVKQQKYEPDIITTYHALSANTQNALDRIIPTDTGSVLSKSRTSSIVSEKHIQIVEDAIVLGYIETSKDTKADTITSVLASSFKRESITPKVPLKSRPEIVINDHLLSIEDFIKKHDTNFKNGLTSAQVEERRKVDGVNVLRKKRRQFVVIKYLRELFGGYNIIMWMAAILCLLCWEPLGGSTPDINNLVLACLLFIAIFLQSTFSFFQQRRSSNLMASFEKLMPHVTTVLRNSQWESVNTWELVSGDVIRLNSGDKIPADIRVLECNQARVEKSALTGEPESVSLNINSNELNPYEAKNIVMFGSSLLEGSATGIVFQTGDRTVMGKIAQITMNTKTEMTTMQREINYFAIVIGSMSIGTGLLTFIIWYAAVRTKYPDFLTYPGIIIACIGVVISFFPEGLPIGVTMTLTLIAKKMKKHKVLVKKMAIIETLGSTTVIASDKTGTITMNKMSLSSLAIQGQPDVNVIDSKKDSTFIIEDIYKTLLALAGLCNKAIYEEEKNEFIGTPTECGILKGVSESVDINAIRLANPVQFEIPFNSRYKFHVTVHKINELFAPLCSDMASKTHICLIKGAPEVIAELCANGYNNNRIEPFAGVLKTNCLKKAFDLASSGERVLAMGFTFLTIDNIDTFEMFGENSLPEDFCFFGLLSLMDPPRPGVAEAVSKCHEGGIKVMMVTGDHPVTAVTIARMVNIITSKKVKEFEEIKQLVASYPPENKKPSRVSKLLCKCHHEEQKQEQKPSIFARLTRVFLPKKAKIIARKYDVQGGVLIKGKDLAEFEIQHWDYVLSHKEIVFARTTPQNKLAIVQQLQRRGEIVTVTGDGVNDAPALKKADIGIAMGIAGTEISKEAAKIVIMDDNFSTIVNGIEQGRLLFDNLKKVIGYLLPAGCFSEILPVLAFVFLGLPLPLTTLQMVIICLGTDTLGSIGIIYEFPETNLMKRMPRNASHDRLISFSAILKIYMQTGMLQLIIAFFMYFYTMSTFNIDTKDLIFAYGNWSQNSTFAGVDLPTRNEALTLSQTGYFVSLVTTQLMNLLTVRTRFQTFFKQRIRPSIFIFMACEMIIVVLYCYIKPLQPYLGSADAKWYHFVFPLVMSLSIFLVDEFKKLLVRSFPKSCLKNLVW